MHYQFVIYDADGDEYFNCLIRDTQLVVNTAVLRKENRTRYSWTVNRVVDPCELIEKKRMELVSQDEENKMAGKIIKDTPVIENEVLYNLAIADALGLAGLYEKAIGYYDKAMSLMKK